MSFCLNKKLLLLITALILCNTLYSKEFEVHGPQGGLSMTITLPDHFNPQTDTCPMVILMHGIFSSKNFTPMPAIARSLAKEVIASIRFNFGGHWSSEGKMQLMTIENEITDAIAIWRYASSLPYVTRIGMLGHSQGGVVASMTAGRIATMPTTTKPFYALVLIAPATVLKNACQNGKLFDARFDPVNPPEYVKCFGLIKLGREYLLTPNSSTSTAQPNPIKAPSSFSMAKTTASAAKQKKSPPSSPNSSNNTNNNTNKTQSPPQLGVAIFIISSISLIIKLLHIIF